MEETLSQILQELKQLKDGQKRLDGRMERMECQVSNMNGRMEHMEGHVSSLGGHMEQMEGHVSSLGGHMERMENRLTGVENELSHVTNELKAVKELGEATFNQVGTLTEFRTEMSQFRCETNERLDQLANELKDHGQVIERLAFRSIAHEADIVSLKRAK